MWLACLLFCAAADEIPPLVRAMPEFSGAIGGVSLAVTATASTNEVPLGSSLILTLTINHVRNPNNVKAPQVAIPQAAVVFQRRIVTAEEVQFLYEIRPHNSDLKEVPPIKFLYYMPDAAEDKRVRTKYTESIPLRVIGTQPAPLPERFRTLLPESDTEPWTPSMAHWLAVPLIVAPFTVGCIWNWRRRDPQGAKLARLKRMRAVRDAWVKLDCGDADGAFRSYLQSRFGVPREALTPLEIQSRLPIPLQPLLNDLDAARFGGAGGDFTRRVRAAIIALEDAS